MLNFVDFRKAFDTYADQLCRNYSNAVEEPEKIVSLIGAVSQGSESCMRLGQENTDWFQITTGLRKGDVFSPLFFNVVFDSIMKKMNCVDVGVRCTIQTTLKGLA